MTLRGMWSYRESIGEDCRKGDDERPEGGRKRINGRSTNYGVNRSAAYMGAMSAAFGQIVATKQTSQGNATI